MREISTHTKCERDGYNYPCTINVMFSESQCVKVGFITVWQDEANQHNPETTHYAMYVHRCYAVTYPLAPDCTLSEHVKTSYGVATRHCDPILFYSYSGSKTMIGN